MVNILNIIKNMHNYILKKIKLYCYSGSKLCIFLVIGCTVEGITGDGTKQGTCDHDHFCHEDGTCVALEEEGLQLF